MCFNYIQDQDIFLSCVKLGQKEMPILYSVAVCGLLAVLLGCGAQDNTTGINCVSSYEEFEKRTFLNNTQNRNKLYHIFYPQNEHSPYAVDITYQTLLPNGTELSIKPENNTKPCTIIKWGWVSSINNTVISLALCCSSCHPGSCYLWSQETDCEMVGQGSKQRTINWKRFQ